MLGSSIFVKYIQLCAIRKREVIVYSRCKTSVHYSIRRHKSPKTFKTSKSSKLYFNLMRFISFMTIYE